MDVLRAFLIAALLGLCGASPRGRYADMTDAEVGAAIARAHSVEPLGARIQSVTEPFLGTPYALGNMGEGPDGDGRDQDPRYNVKSADCTTFVEHALAFALGRDLAEARRLLDAIRYHRGRVGYGTRRHWPEAQWVHGLVAEGFVEDVTERIGGSVERASVSIDPERLRNSAHRELARNLRAAEVPVGTFTVPFIPADRLPALSDRLEAGLILNVVKQPRADLLVRISHQALIVKTAGRTFVRHASTSGSVIDQPLAEFIERQRGSRSWPLAGFNLLRVKER